MFWPMDNVAIDLGPVPQKLINTKYPGLDLLLD